MKKIEKKGKNQSGFTLIEMIVSLSIIGIFYLTVCTTMANGSKMYLQETISGNNKTVLQTVLDDMGSYITSGTSAQIYYSVTREDSVANGYDTLLDLTEMGAQSGIVYIVTEPTSSATSDYVVYLLGDNNEKVDITSDIGSGTTLTNFVDTFVGNGIDLKTMTISLSADNSRIDGLAYGTDYYQNMELELQITESDELSGAYELVLIGYTSTDTYEVTKIVKNLNQ